MTHTKVDNIQEALNKAENRVKQAAYDSSKLEVKESSFITAENRESEEAKRPSQHVKVEVWNEDKTSISLTNFTGITKAYRIRADSNKLVISYSFELPEDFEKQG